MSTPRRAEARRLARDQARARSMCTRDEMGVLAAWCASDDDLDDTRKLSHDTLIRMMGWRRRGGVSWAHWHAGPDAYHVLGEMERDETSADLLAHYAQLRVLLEEHGGLLVLAMAPGEVPR